MSPKSIQSAFFASMSDPQAFRLMFDQQPNVFFFVKDRESRLIAASEPMYSRLSPLSRARPYLLATLLPLTMSFPICRWLQPSFVRLIQVFHSPP